MSKWTRLLAVTGILYGALVAFEPAARAGELEEGPKCCSYGTECDGEQLCCNPGSIGALNCSPQKAGYCRDSCS